MLCWVGTALYKKIVPFSRKSFCLYKALHVAMNLSSDSFLCPMLLSVLNQFGRDRDQFPDGLERISEMRSMCASQEFSLNYQEVA